MGIKVTIKDIRAVRFCSDGVRHFAEERGLSWEDFLRDGIDADELRKLDDALVNKIIEQAELRNGREV